MTGNFEFRTILPGEAGRAAEIESICFPPAEACPKEAMCERALKAPDLFLVAVDKEKGVIAGFLNGIATNEAVFRDEFFTDISLNDPDGKNIMLLGLDVLPEYRRRGLASQIVKIYAAKEAARGRKRLILTCLEDKIKMYEGMGFEDLGISNSTWAGESWHDMDLRLSEENAQGLVFSFSADEEKTAEKTSDSDPADETPKPGPDQEEKEESDLPSKKQLNIFGPAAFALGALTVIFAFLAGIKALVFGIPALIVSGLGILACVLLKNMKKYLSIAGLILAAAGIAAALILHSGLVF